MKIPSEAELIEMEGRADHLRNYDTDTAERAALDIEALVALVREWCRS